MLMVSNISCLLIKITTICNVKFASSIFIFHLSINVAVNPYQFGIENTILNLQVVNLASS